jgi:hypothetical protein
VLGLQRFDLGQFRRNNSLVAEAEEWPA